MKFYQWYNKIGSNNYFFVIDIDSNKEQGLCWGFSSDGVTVEISNEIKHPGTFQDKWNKIFYKEAQLYNFDREMIKEFFKIF